ncbi:Uncharacterised protein [Leminorella richardii]|uniref:Uncharacterized protein n=1 Tax=Leminorella richardii TaxID=158841 RepID=A0A2X4US36_9GAMM|nr:hypothetical protein [Leminorella richardii]SQI41673.1 Uncharacterised protein [Leminorella richardii]
MIQHPVAGTVLITALKSWRYIAALSAAAVIVGLCLVVSSGKGSFLFAMAMGGGLFAQYYCWRMWMDCRLFALLYRHPEREAEFDAALGLFWGRKAIPDVGMEVRWRGARRLLFSAAAGVATQWILTLMALVVAG